MENYELIGVENKSFTTKDGKLIEGADLYAKWAINPERGAGYKTDRFFLSAAKLAALSFKPTPGQTVQIFYNRFGKVETMRLVSDDDIVIA